MFSSHPLIICSVFVYFIPLDTLVFIFLDEASLKTHDVTFCVSLCYLLRGLIPFIIIQYPSIPLETFLAMKS